MRPKFKVGEVVLLRSKDFPKLNGEYVVEYCSVEPIGTRVEYKGKTFRHRKAVIAYFLEGVVDDDGDYIFWSESALRKKHIPGELSFTDLMASLSSPKLITHQA